MFNKVHILFSGYSHQDPHDLSCLRANCTCTLIQTMSGYNIIIDTMTAWDGERILDALKSLNLQPKDIYAVICTHGHSDHFGCNYLFPTAKFHFVGSCISSHDKYYSWDTNQSYQLIDGDDTVQIEFTPGHTLVCVSVIVYKTEYGVVGICGDLFERVDDIVDSKIWLEAGSENIKLQRKNRLRMIEMCTQIIPGHGDMFAITDKMRSMLRHECEEN